MDLNDVPATGNRWLLTDVLRNAWDFKGFVVTDANAVDSLITHGYARDAQDAAYKAFTAGLNMDMASGTYLKHWLASRSPSRPHHHEADRRRRLPILEAKIRSASSTIPTSTNPKCDADSERARSAAKLERTRGAALHGAAYERK